MKAIIIYRNYYNYEGTELSVGGIQTYITNLIPVLQKLNYDVVIYQLANKDFTIKENNIEVYGFYKKNQKNMGAFLFSKCKGSINSNEDIIIFATDFLTVDSGKIKSITIQHGVFWDTYCIKQLENGKRFASFVNQNRRSWNLIKQIELANKVVCVDYNFLNWYRATVSTQKADITVIPNFTRIDNDVVKPSLEGRNINIIFARRLIEHRGTRVFVSAIKRILNEYNNINVTVAGEGPDEEYLRKSLSSYKNVTFIKYKNTESMEIHSKQDIALIPTTGSEGTSLSLLEAMACKCAVVCTNVGGMTNIVLDHYNGLMISPDANSLFCACKELLDNRNLLSSISEKGYETVKEVFSYEIWADKWKDVIISLRND